MNRSSSLRDYLDVCHSGSGRLDSWFDDVVRTLAGVVDTQAGVSMTVSSWSTKRGCVIASATDEPASHYLSFDSLTPDLLARIFRPMRSRFMADHLGVESLHELAWGRDQLRPGIVDGAGIVVDDDDVRLAASVPLTREERSRIDNRSLARLQRHLSGGWTRRRNADWVTRADAIIDGAGRAQLAAESTSGVVAAATEIARALDRDFSSEPDPDAARMWDELWDAGWSVAAVTDTDGKRLIVLRRMTMPGIPLTARERIAIGRRARGDSFKCIASDLGVSTSTARTHVRRGLRKLGLDDAASAFPIGGSS